MVTVSGSSHFQGTKSYTSPIPGDEPPVIDLSSADEDQLARDIANACSTYGFFQVTSHGIPRLLLERFREQCSLFFDLQRSLKSLLKRNATNARGFFDDELTQQRRDWKECLDIGIPGSRSWEVQDGHELNACLDGFNQLPGEELPDFRKTIVEYFEACSALSHKLARLMSKGIGRAMDDPFIRELKDNHSSYLRLNYYPPFNSQEKGVLGISPHRDAGFLTVLLQDDDCHSLQALKDGKWLTVKPIPGAITINTGDMAQVWSNGKYVAPPHRVLTDPRKKRYSAPFFYNPGYETFVKPVVQEGETAIYHDVLWGYYRAVRFAGDMTDLGVEIQVKSFDKGNERPSPHLVRQAAFNKGDCCNVPFDIERYRQLLQDYPDD